MVKRILSDEEFAEFKKGLKENNGYCPCKIYHTEDTKCMCKEFRENGICECGVYKKEENK